MNSNLKNNTLTVNGNDQGSSKKVWQQPDLAVIDKDIIEGASAPGSDGGHTSTFS